MAKKNSGNADGALRMLLEEGSRSYGDAVTAILEFQKEVQKRCRRTMETSLDKYSVALDLKPRLKAEEVQPYTGPKLTDWNESWWSVGVVIRRRNLPTLRWWESFCTFDYEDDWGWSCSVSESMPTSAADLLFQRFNGLRHKSRLDVDGYDIGLWQAVQPEQVLDCEKVLGSLMQEWMGLWTKIGGMKAVMKS
jgi:hypothetical protein